MNKNKLLYCIILANFIAFLTVPFVSEAEENVQPTASEQKENNLLDEDKTSFEQELTGDGENDEYIRETEDVDSSAIQQKIVKEEKVGKKPDEMESKTNSYGENSKTCMREHSELKAETNKTTEEKDYSLEEAAEQSADMKKEPEREKKLEHEESVRQEVIPMFQKQGWIGVNLLAGTQLDARWEESENGKPIIVLEYTGRSLAQININNRAHIIFELPNEIMDSISELKMNYSVPGGLLGLGSDKGSFSHNDITLAGNLAYVQLPRSTGILLASRYDFTLTIVLEKYPITQSGVLRFSGELVDTNAVDINVITNNFTQQTLEAPIDNIPPQSPAIDSVYSNDTKVTGTGEPGTQIVLTIEEQVYEGTVDENGNYSVPIPVQNPGTRISAVLIDKAGNTSEVTETSVIAATISFYQVPRELRFEATAIRPGLVRVPRQDPDWSITVKDTRGPGSEIQLLAKADPLVSEGERHTLPDALVYVDETGKSRALSDKPIEVFRGQTGDVPISTIQWDKEEGPYVEVDPADVYAGSYRTTITWTLVDAP